MIIVLAVAALQAMGAQPGIKVADAEKIVCRREAVTGSRAHYRKVCLSRAQWEAVHAGARTVKVAMEGFTSGAVGGR